MPTPAVEGPGPLDKAVAGVGGALDTGLEKTKEIAAAPGKFLEARDAAKAKEIAAEQARLKAMQDLNKANNP